MPPAIPVPPSSDPPNEASEPWALPPVTLTVVDTPLSFVLLDVADQAGVSVVVPDDADTALLTLDFREVDAQTVFETIGERMGLIAVFDSGVVSFLDPAVATRDFVVFRASFADPDQAAQSVQDVVGADAKVSRFDDRIVVSGPPRVLSKALQFSDQLLTGPDGWRLDVRIVQVSDSFRRDLGLDWTLDASAGFGVGASAGDFAPPLTGADASLVVRVIAEATEQGREAILLNAGTLYVLEGGQSTMNQGDSVPLPKFQTSPEGTTTLVGYDYIDTGFALDARASRVPGGVRLSLTPSVSAVTGFVNDAPITRESRVDVEAVVRPGEWVVISGLSTSSASVDQSRLPGTRPPFFGSDDLRVSDDSVLFLVRADRVFSAEVTP